MNQELERIIASQAEEIKQLKEALNQRLSSSDSVNINDILSFYTGKYLEIYQEVLENRLGIIGDEIASIEDEINKYNEESIALSNAEEENSNIKETQANLQTEISNRYIKLEELRFKADSEISNIQQTSIASYMQYQEMIDLYDAVLREYFVGAIDDIQVDAKLYEIVNFLKTKGHEISTNLLASEKEVTKIYNDLDSELEQIRLEINKLNQEKEELNDRILVVSYEQVNSLKQELKINESRKQEFKEKLSQLYENKKKEHLHKLEDEATRAKILNLDNASLASKLEDLLPIFHQELLNVDTESNKAYQKEKRLKMLKEHLLELEQVELKKEALMDDYNYHKNIYNDVLKKIKEIEEYIHRLNNTLTSRKEYKNFLEYRNEYLLRRAKLVERIKELNKTYSMIQDTRRIAVCDPFSKIPLSEIDKELAASKVSLDDAVKEFEKEKQMYDDVANQPLNLRIINLIKDKDEMEKNLPSFYEKLSALKLVIDRKYDDILTLKDELREYERLKMQVEELTNEDNN